MQLSIFTWVPQLYARGIQDKDMGGEERGDCVPAAAAASAAASAASAAAAVAAATPLFLAVGGIRAVK
eukprot:COSAG05_NODE_354_length_10862_cov_59.954659_14_plen_68_part_00